MLQRVLFSGRVSQALVFFSSFLLGFCLIHFWEQNRSLLQDNEIRVEVQENAKKSELLQLLNEKTLNEEEINLLKTVASNLDDLKLWQQCYTNGPESFSQVRDYYTKHNLYAKWTPAAKEFQFSSKWTTPVKNHVSRKFKFNNHKPPGVKDTAVKATRYQLVKEMVKWLKKEKRFGDVLEVSGNDRWTDYFDKSTSTFTVGKYPNVDCHDLPYDDAMFDWVFFSMVLEHARKPWLCVQEAHRVLRSGGYIVILVPAWYPIHPEDGKYADYWRFLPDALVSLVDDFSSIEFEGNWGTREFMKYYLDKGPNAAKGAHELAKKRADIGFPLMTWIVARK